MANEKTLIDVNEAIKLLRGSCVAKYPSTFCMGLFAAADEIAKLPTVEAVEVVRCEKCKSCKISGAVGREIYYCTNPKGLTGVVRAEQYCSEGERKDNEA